MCLLLPNANTNRGAPVCSALASINTMVGHSAWGTTTSTWASHLLPWVFAGLNNSFTNNVLAMVNTGTCDGALRSSQHPGKCVLPAKGENQGRCSSFQFEQNIMCVDFCEHVLALARHSQLTLFLSCVVPALSPLGRCCTAPSLQASR